MAPVKKNNREILPQTSKKNLNIRKNRIEEGFVFCNPAPTQAPGSLVTEWQLQNNQYCNFFEAVSSRAYIG